MIVKYIGSEYPNRHLIVGKYYLVRDISNYNIVVFGNFIIFRTRDFVDIDGNEITVEYYKSKLCAARRNISSNTNVLCISDFGKNINTGMVYTVKRTAKYLRIPYDNVILEEMGNEVYDINQFIIWSDSIERYLKLLNLKYDITITK